MVKKLSCVSCGSLKRFPHTFTRYAVRTNLDFNASPTKSLGNDNMTPFLKEKFKFSSIILFFNVKFIWKVSYIQFKVFSKFNIFELTQGYLKQPVLNQK